uniref:CKX3 n=1 Tax=Arundo donax TaxID=35708 RepID=A0A0A9G7P0_ARUDO
MKFLLLCRTLSQEAKSTSPQQCHQEPGPGHGWSALLPWLLL